VAVEEMSNNEGYLFRIAVQDKRINELEILLRVCADRIAENTATLDMAAARIKKLEAALREIATATVFTTSGAASLQRIANAALAPEQGQVTRSSPDIVERMKNYIHGEHDDYIPEVLQLACAEIERLRAKAATPLEASYQNAIDEALVVRHLGIAKGSPRDELNQILSWEVAVALDPRVSEAAQDLINQGTRNAAQPSPAADRIEALEAALREIAELQSIAGEDAMVSMLMHHVEIARAALAPETHE
jgi:hypothetical protein